MIQMICGSTVICGELKNAASAPFSCDPAIETRLLRLGVAKQCDEITSPAESGSVSQNENAWESMTIPELKAYADEHEIDVADCKKKQEYLTAILQRSKTVDDTEPLPALSVEEPIA